MTAVSTAALATLLFLLPQRIAAQEQPNPLDAVVDEALRENLELAQQTLAAAGARADAREARGRMLPSLLVSSRYSEQSGTLDLGDFVNPAYAALNEIIGETRFPTDLSLTLPRAHESRLRVTQPLFEPAAIAGYALARHRRDGQELQRRVAARRIAAQAQTAYLNVAAARSGRRVWEATLELVVEGERVAERLVDAGRATPDVVFRARAERSDVEQRLAESRESERAAARAFNRLLRRPLDAPVESPPDSLLRFDLTITREEAVARALAGREELAAGDAGLRAAEAGIRLATASHLPSVALALDYGFQGDAPSFRREEDYTVASVVLSWSVFDGGSSLARGARARADAERLRLRRAEVEDLVRLDVRQAYATALTARDAIATAEARLDAAHRTFALVRRRYDEGLSTQLEFLDARSALTSAELNRVRSIYQYAASYVDLERAAALRVID